MSENVCIYEHLKTHERYETLLALRFVRLMTTTAFKFLEYLFAIRDGYFEILDQNFCFKKRYTRWASEQSKHKEFMMQKLDWNGKECDGWIFEKGELKPKRGASLSNTWVFDGKEFKPKIGASLSNTWVYDGKVIKPKINANSSNTWVYNGKEVMPKNGANSSNKWDIGTAPMAIVIGKIILRLF